MNIVRKAALVYGILGLKPEDYAKLIDAAIDGTSEWYKQEDSKKCLKELGAFCLSRFVTHLKPIKDCEKKDEKTDVDSVVPPVPFL